MVQAELAYVLRVIDETSSTMEKIRGGIGLVGSTLGQLGGGFASIGNIMTDFAVGGPAGAAIGAFGELAKGLQDCIKEATSSEAVFTSLGAAVTRSGIAWDTVATATKNALLAMQKTTVYSDEQLAAALERLLTFGLSYDDAMKALGETLDFAAAKHMDLESAATLVGKAMDGNTAIMKRYGVDIVTTKDQAAALSAAQDAAAKAIKAMGDGVATWVTNVTAAIGADTLFEQGLVSAKDKAAFLIEQFKAGNIDLSQFTTAMQSLGVPLDAVALKGGSAEAVLAKLNEQFGGAAQAQASTYAGIQERLKNATSELGEKIGGILLPSLASLTESMIPLVDGFGKWFDQVRSAPDFAALSATIKQAFSEILSSLTALVASFDDLNVSMKEAADAIGITLPEGFTAFGVAAQVFKGLLDMFVIVPLKITTTAIEGFSVVVKGFAQGFKDAADFISPILTQIVTAVRFCIDTLRTIFQDFYNWLVGGSLWTDMWNQMLSIATQMIGQLLGALSTAFFKPMQDAFSGAMKALGDLWSVGWQNIQAAGQTAWDLIRGGAKVWEDLFKGDFQGALDQVKRNWDASWTAIQDAGKTVWRLIQDKAKDWEDLLKGDLKDALDQIQRVWNMAWDNLKIACETILRLIETAITGFFSLIQTATTLAWQVIGAAWQMGLAAITGAVTVWGGVISAIVSGIMGVLQGIVSAGVAAMIGSFNQLVAAAESAVATAQALFAQAQQAAAGAQSAVSNAASQMASMAQSSTGQLTDAFGNAYNAIAGGAEWLWNTLVGGSIWTDTLDEMQAQTKSALGNIVGDFQGAFNTIPLSVPALAAPASAPASAAASAAGISAVGSGSQTISIPVTVVLDGQVISRHVETRIINRIDTRSGRRGF